MTPWKAEEGEAAPNVSPPDRAWSVLAPTGAWTAAAFVFQSGAWWAAIPMVLVAASATVSFVMVHLVVARQVGRCLRRRKG